MSTDSTEYRVLSTRQSWLLASVGFEGWRGANEELLSGINWSQERPLCSDSRTTSKSPNIGHCLFFNFFKQRFDIARSCNFQLICAASKDPINSQIFVESVEIVLPIISWTACKNSCPIANVLSTTVQHQSNKVIFLFRYSLALPLLYFCSSSTTIYWKWAMAP